MSEEYDERGVMNDLRKKGVGFETGRTTTSRKLVYIEPGMLGIKLLGKLDYLINYHHWHLTIRKKVYTG